MTEINAAPGPTQTAPRPAGGALARAILVIALAFLPLGLLLPVLETTRLWVFKTSYSLIDTVHALVEEGELALGLFIALFSIVTPSVKAVAVIALHRRPAGSGAGALARWVERLGKWSLTDVLVIALLIVLASGTGLRLAAEPGLWFFAASAVLLMVASDLVVRDLER
jgi:paraquat-inducible protein A